MSHFTTWVWSISSDNFWIEVLMQLILSLFKVSEGQTEAHNNLSVKSIRQSAEIQKLIDFVKMKPVGWVQF